MADKKRVTYKSAGVDISAGDEAVNRIKGLARSTYSDNVLSGLGLFGAFFELDIEKYKHPVLVSSVDGVGTKLKIAFEMGIHDTVGEDLVNHCVNDIMTSGADPLFFLDYLAVGKLRPEVVEKICEGMSRACRQAGCSLIGGETAEMPGFYALNEYDLAGSIVGVVEKEKIIDGRTIKRGDLLMGLPSNGLHTNGYSLARKVLLEIAGHKLTDRVDELRQSLGEEFLRVHLCYNVAIKAVRDLGGLHGIAHVTGGGIVGNTKRLIPRGRCIKIDWNAWHVPPIFGLIQKLGDITDEEMRRVFNLGIGEILIIDKASHDVFQTELKRRGFSPVFVGEVC